MEAKTVVCKMCGKEFVQDTAEQCLCSVDCARKWVFSHLDERARGREEEMLFRWMVVHQMWHKVKFTVDRQLMSDKWGEFRDQLIFLEQDGKYSYRVSCLNVGGMTLLRSRTDESDYDRWRGRSFWAFDMASWDTDWWNRYIGCGNGNGCETYYHITKMGKSLRFDA